MVMLYFIDIFMMISFESVKLKGPGFLKDFMNLYSILRPSQDYLS